jgi:hypothetical protein
MARATGTLAAGLLLLSTLSSGASAQAIREQFVSPEQYQFPVQMAGQEPAYGMMVGETDGMMVGETVTESAAANATDYGTSSQIGVYEQESTDFPWRESRWTDNIVPTFGVHHRGEGYGYNHNYTRVQGMLPLSKWNDSSLTFFEGGLLIDNDGDSGFNAGLGHRSYVPAWNSVVGAYIFPRSARHRR